MITAYRSQADAEAGFRQLKDRHVVSFSPMFHWTEQKIRVHVFYCVLALAIAHLMRRLAAQEGAPGCTCRSASFCAPWQASAKP